MSYKIFNGIQCNVLRKLTVIACDYCVQYQAKPGAQIAINYA